MSHQVNYYVTPDDMKLIVAKLMAIETMHVLSRKSSSPVAEVVPEMSICDPPYLTYYLVRAADLASVVTRSVPAQGYWVVDDLYSPVVECSTSYVGEGIIRRDRVYFKNGYYGADGAWIEKPEAFRKWGMKVLRTIKKSLVLLPSGYYIGAEAAARVERGESILKDM